MSVLKDSQRKLLDETRCLVGSGALIPPHCNYKQQLKVYENRTREAPLSDARAAPRLWRSFATRRSPGGSRPRLTGARRRIDTAARRTTARELGHDRISVVATYIGGG